MPLVALTSGFGLSLDLEVAQANLSVPIS